MLDRQKRARWLVLRALFALFLAPLSVTAGPNPPARAKRDSTLRDPIPTPPIMGLLDRLRASQELFEATVLRHSVAQVAWQVHGHRWPLQDCEELELRVTNVLHGGCIPEHVRLRTLRGVVGPEVSAGTQVLALGSRSEADDWTLWGDARLVEENGLVLPDIYESSSGPDSRRMLKISDVRSPADDAGQEEPDRLFRRVRNLQIAVVIGKTILFNNAADLLCSPIGAALGRPHVGPVHLRFIAPPNAPCAFIGVGDTLVIPDSDPEPGGELEFRGCPDYFLAT